MKLLAIALSSSVLVACGGGGGGTSTAPLPTAPTAVLNSSNQNVAAEDAASTAFMPMLGAQTLTGAQTTDDTVLFSIAREQMAKLPAYVGSENAQGGYTLVRVDEVKEIDAIDDDKRNGYMQQLRQLTGEELFRAYLADARKNADVSMKTFAEGEKK